MADLSFNVVALDRASATFIRIGEQFDRLSRKADQLDRKDVKVKVEVDQPKLTSSINALALLGRSITQLALPIVAVGATPAIASLGASAVATAGSLYLLPAALGAAGVAAGTLAVGLAHVGDALGPTGTPAQLEKVNEAVAKLAPSARATVAEIRGLGPAWTSLRLDVQEHLFAGVASQVQALAGAYLPILRDTLGGVATGFNQAGAGVTAFLTSRAGVADMSVGMDNVRAAVTTLVGAAVPLVRAVTDIFVVGAGFLPGFATSITDIATRFAGFISAARATGELAGWIRDGISTLGQLGSVAGSVGGVLVSVFQAATASGADTLGTTQRLTGELNTFLSAGVGNTGLVTLFTTINQVIDALLPGLLAVASAIALGIVALGPSLPPLATAFSAVAIAVAPLITDLAILASVILPPLAGLITIISPLLGPFAAGLLGWLVVTQVTAAFIAVKVALIGFAVAQGAVTATAGASLGILGALKVAILGIGFAIAANPIGILVTVLVAVGAALVFAYNHSETFRNIVDGAFRAVGQLGIWLWENALKPAFDGIMTGLRWIGETASWLWTNAISPAFTGISAAVQAVGAAAMWLWTNAIQPAFEFISLAARVLFAVVATVVLTPIFLLIHVVGAAVTWLWENAFRPAFQAIGDFVSRVWTSYILPVFDAIRVGIDLVGQANVAFYNNVIKPVWDGIGAAISFVWTDIIRPAWDAAVWFINNVLGPANMWLFNNIIRPVWDGIGAAISFVWNAGIRPVFDAIVGFINNVLGPANMWLFNNIIRPVWDGIGLAIRLVWDNVIRPVFDALRGGVDLMARAFQAAVGFIQTVWERLREVVAAPVRFVVNVVYNQGIRPAWNFVAGLVGLGQLPPFTFAEGGPVPMTPGARRGHDSVPLLAMPDEHMWTTGDVARAGGHRNVERLRDNPRAALAALNSGRIVEGADHEGPGISASGFGGVRPHVAKAGHYLKNRFGIGVVGGVGARPGPSDHPSGHALDFMTRGENGTSLANYAVANAAHMLVKYVIWRQRINSGGGWSAMANRGSATANHFDHVHVSFKQGGSIGSNFSGSGSASSEPAFDPIAFVTEKFAGALRFVGQLAGQFGGTPFGRGIAGLGRKAYDDTFGFALAKAQEYALQNPVVDIGLGLLNLVTGAGVGGIVRTISDAARARGFGFPGAVIGTATGLVESGLRNLNFGDRDSLGVFQQRPSQGWGSPAQVTNVRYAADKFFSRFPANWRSMDPGVVAQSVQRSAFPARYGQRMGQARALVTQHGGGFANGGVVTRPTFGLIGEDGPEAVVPLNRPARARQVLAQAGVGGVGGRQVTVHFTGDVHIHKEADVDAVVDRLNALMGG